MRRYLKFVIRPKDRVWQKKFIRLVKAFFPKGKSKLWEFNHRINGRRIRNYFVMRRATPKTYERLFGAKLRCKGKRKWKELVPAKIPQALVCVVEEIVISPRLRVGS